MIKGHPQVHTFHIWNTVSQLARQRSVCTRTCCMRACEFHTKGFLNAITVLAAIVLAAGQLTAQEHSQNSPSTADAWNHPRLFIDATDIPEARERWASPAFAGMRARALAMAALDQGQPLDGPYDHRARQCAIAYLITGEEHFGRRAGELAREMMALDWWHDPKAKGLTRAMLAASVAIAYDLTGHLWPESQRQATSPALLTIAQEMDHWHGPRTQSAHRK